MRNRIPLLCLFSALISISAQAAESETYDHLIVSAPESSIQWSDGEVAEINGLKRYLKIGLIYLTVRSPQSSPIETTFTSYGIPGLRFFELGPLVPVTHGITSEVELRTALQLSAGNAECGSSCGTDLGLLEYHTGLAVEDPADLKLQWFRKKMLGEMKRLKISSFSGMVERLSRQREFLAQAWGLPPSDPRLLLAIWKRTGVSAGTNQAGHASLKPDIRWSELVDVLRDTVKPRRVLHTQTVSHSHPLIVAYIVNIPEQGAREFRGEILVSAAGGNPARIPVRANITPAKSTVGIILMIVSSPAVMLVLGAFVGYLGFYLQQNHLRKSQEKNQFLQSKQQHSKQLLDFFDNRYTALIQPGPEDEELGQVNDVYRALVAEGFYSLMKMSEVERLNQICSVDARISNRLKSLDQLLRKNFGEYMQTNA